MAWLILIGVYFVLCIMIYFTIRIIESKVPETHPFKKWWRKYIVTDTIED
jgi:hypothetical protein